MGKLRKLGIGFLVVVGIFAAVAAIGYLAGDDGIPDLTLQEIEGRALRGVSTAEILGDIDRYTGEIVYLEGQIIQLHHRYGDVYDLNVGIDGQEEEQNVMLRHASPDEPMVFSRISFYGMVTGASESRAMLTGATLNFVDMDALWLNVTDAEAGLFPEIEIPELDIPEP